MISVMDSQYIQGGQIGPGAEFGDGNVFEGVTIVAPSNFGEGNTFINVTWKCLDGCKKGPCGCCSDVSTVGIGATIVNNTGDHVTFTDPSTSAMFIEGPCGSLTLPECTDCEPITEGVESLEYAGNAIIVRPEKQVTPEEWCKSCGKMGVVAGEGDVDIAP